MGLDMYLMTIKKNGETGRKQRKQLLYWRKVNAIHQWFVTEIQGGKDDCDVYEVPREKLAELLDLCNAAADIRGSEPPYKLLPTMPGIFFGSTEYDDYYREELTNTAAQLKSLLSSEDFSKETFYYQSSW